MIFTALLLLATTSAPGAGAAQAFHRCECRDLPRLFEELMEQEKLRELCQQYLNSKTPPNDEFLSIKEVSERLQWRLNQFIAGRRASQGSPGKSASPPGAAPAFGTDFLHKDCQLMRYPPPDASGHQPDPVPSSPEEVRAQNCSAISEFLLAHEGLHQKRCRERFENGGDGSAILVPENYLKEDLEAYTAGIKTLRREMANLARNDCGWKGSSRKMKKGGMTVVPTAEQVQTLKDAVQRKANALSKGAKR